MFDNLAKQLRQIRPPPPTFTESDIPRQNGRVFIVTGGYSGIGYELIKILYPTGATIYMAGRSQDKADAAVKSILADAAAENAGKPPQGSGTINTLLLDLNDLNSVRTAAARFASRESRLDILWNNAGAGGVPYGTNTAQGFEFHMGVNCVAPLYFTQKLEPLLRQAATLSPPGATRVLWASSIGSESHTPRGGVDIAALDARSQKDPIKNYGVSKAGNWMLAAETARRWGQETSPGKGDGIVSAVYNPGQLNTPSYRHQSWLFMAWFKYTLYPAKLGAYTMAFAGFSPKLGLEVNGKYVVPWGRLQERSAREDIEAAIEKGRAREFWEWCEKMYEPHL